MFNFRTNGAVRCVSHRPALPQVDRGLRGARFGPENQNRPGTIATTLRGQSHGDDVEVRIEASQVVGVRCNHSCRSLTCGKSH